MLLLLSARCAWRHGMLVVSLLAVVAATMLLLPLLLLSKKACPAGAAVQFVLQKERQSIGFLVSGVQASETAWLHACLLQPAGRAGPSTR